MVLGYVILYVPDVPASVAFYERAFGLARRFVHESGAYAELETGATALAFAGETFTPTAHLIAPSRPEAKAPAMEVGLVVEDVPAAYARAVAEGAAGVVAPVTKPWGQVVSYVRDRDGFLVELCSKVTP
ncbi:MAG: VOC family protein [Gemmatimonadetes bacterium]|nr:VOC family protein [Gemmatimonadota bacterium]